MNPAFDEFEVARFHGLNEFLARFFHGPLGCDVQSEEGVAFVDCPFEGGFGILVQAEEEELRNCHGGVVFSNEIFFRFGVGVLPNERLHVVIGSVLELCRVAGEGREVVEEQEVRGGVLQGGR